MDNFENNENKTNGNEPGEFEAKKTDGVQYYSDGVFSDERPNRANAGAGQASAVNASKTSQGQAQEFGAKAAGGQSAPVPPNAPKRGRGWSGLPGWGKALIIIAAVIVVIALLTTGCNKAIDSIAGAFSDSFVSGVDNTVTTDFGHDYIGVVDVVGTISEDSSDTYNHQYILNAIDAMMDDGENKGIILYVDTPGGSVFASDELYLKIKEYQKKTKRPVYASMQSMAASGGYYISAPCDKIIANRNCWTGSIGVTLGTMYDVSELLDKIGVKTNTITSGANKAMGSNVEAMTSEQREIFQSLVDEAYEQFVEIVAKGRDMKASKARKLADGRIYTAKQALSNGLIDEIGTFEEAAADMKAEYKLGDCELEYFESPTTTDWTSLLGSAADAIADGAGAVSADALQGLIDMNGRFEFSYICPIQK